MFKCLNCRLIRVKVGEARVKLMFMEIRGRSSGGGASSLRMRWHEFSKMLSEPYAIRDFFVSSRYVPAYAISFWLGELVDPTAAHLTRP